jgi:hypothetical protein
MSILLFLYGFFILTAFRYGSKLTEKLSVLFWGLGIGIPMMLLAPGVYLNWEWVFVIYGILFFILLIYQFWFVFVKKFYPAKVGLVIHLLIFAGLALRYWLITK